MPTCFSINREADGVPAFWLSRLPADSVFLEGTEALGPASCPATVLHHIAGQTFRLGLQPLFIARLKLCGTDTFCVVLPRPGRTEAM